VETHSDLVIDDEGAEVLEVFMGVVGGEGDQQEENPCKESRQGLAIQKWLPWRRNTIFQVLPQGSELHPVNAPA
jgi:hypothetical protein